MSFAFLWNKRSRSDVTVLITPPAGGDTIPSTSSDASSTGPITTLRLHALVLSSASPNYFRPRLDRWAERQQEPHTQTGSTAAEPDDSKQHTAASAASPDTGSSMAAPAPAAVPAADNRPRALALEPASASTGDTAPPQAAQDDEPVLSIACLLDEPHTVPEAVLKHAYTGQLPDDYTVLIWMVWRADYLDMKTTVDACLSKLQQLADSKQLSVSDTVLVTQLPDLQTPDTRDSVDTLIRTLLPQHFEDTRKVVTTPELLEQFEELPFSALQQWSQLGSQVTVDHENTRVLLLTAWHDTHHDHEAELSAMVRLDLLSVSFHLQVLLRLPWFRPVGKISKQHASLHVLMHLLSPDRKYASERLAADGTVLKQLPKSAEQHTLEFTEDEVSQLWARKQQGWTHPSSPYICGWDWKFMLWVKPTEHHTEAEPDYMVELSVTVSWPDAVRQHVQATPMLGLKMNVIDESGGDYALEEESLICSHQEQWRYLNLGELTCEVDLWAVLQHGLVIHMADLV